MSTYQIIGNSPYDANVVFLSDIHTKKRLIEERAKLVDKYTSWSRKNIVLCEGLVHGIEYNHPMSDFMKKKAHFVGWEDPRQCESGNGCLNDLMALAKKNTHLKTFSNWPKKDREIYDQIQRALEHIAHLRTQNMIDVTRFYLQNYPMKKIFVVAGQSHFYMESGFNILNAFKDVKATLILFNEPIDQEEDLRYLETLYKDAQTKEKRALFPFLRTMLPYLAISLTFEYAYPD